MGGIRNYLIECPCGLKRDLWDAGGAMGKGSETYTYSKCSACQRRTWQLKRRKTDEERAELDALPGGGPDARRFYSFGSKRDAWLVALMRSAPTFLDSCEPTRARGGPRSVLGPLGYLIRLLSGLQFVSGSWR